MRLSDLPNGRLTIIRDRTGIWWVLVGGRVRWAITLREAFAIAEGMRPC